jgi:uncharacterized damage-inducible protein DinB
MSSDQKSDLLFYLRRGRDAVVWKLHGLDDYDVRRPLVASGTNLLGLVKHLVGVEVGYLGDTFGRPFAEAMLWAGHEDEPNVDMWATADESRSFILGLYERACAHSDATIDALDLDAVGRVPWWPEDRRNTTLHRILAHVIAETHRHAGHADLVREMIDGSAGVAAEHSNLPAEDGAWWRDYYAKVEQAAQMATGHRATGG